MTQNQHTPKRKSLFSKGSVSEQVTVFTLATTAVLPVLVTIAITAILLHESTALFREISIIQFLTENEWSPQIGKFGVKPLLTATLMTSGIAILTATPLGVLIAILLSEFSTKKVKGIVKPLIEVIAGIPTVVLGYFALNTVTPALQWIWGRDNVSIFNTAAAGITVGILIVPIVVSMAEDAINAVPEDLRQASKALSATKWQVATKVVVPAAMSGIGAGVILALSRAVGETMIVAIAAGAGPKLTFNPFESAETMTGHIVRISGGDLSYNSIDYISLFAIALVIFLMITVLNLLTEYLVRTLRKEYS